MAIKKIIEIDVDQVQAMGGLDALQKSLGEVEKKTSSLKTEYRKAQQEVAELGDKFGATSKQAIEAAKRAGELADKIADAKALTDAFNPDAKFKAVSASLTGVASGFSAYQGALGLVGKESKNLEAQLLKVQSAMALAQGLQGLGEAKDSFIQLKAVAINAFDGIKKAIGATGIGLLVVALGAIYTYWDDIKEAVSGVSEEQKKLNAQSQKNLDQEQKKLEAIGDQDNILKLQGKSEREILGYKKQQTNEAISAAEINLKNIAITNEESKKAAAQNYSYLKSFLDFISIPQRFLYENGAKAINALIGLINKIPGVDIKARVDENFGDKATDYLAKLVFDPEAVAKEGAKTIAEQKKVLDKLKNDRAGYQLEINKIDELSEEEKLKRLKALNDQYNRDLAQTETDFDVSDLAKLDAKNQAKRDLEQKYKDDLVSQQQQHELKIAQITYDSEDAQLERKKLVRQQEFDLANQTFGKIAGIFGKNSKIGKAYAVGQAIMNTYQGITAELATKAVTPYEIGLKVANIAFVASTGFKAVKNILSTNPMSSGGGGSSSAGGASGGTSSAPQFNLVGQSSTNQLTATIAGQQNRPVQTFVVGSQVTSQQALDRNAQQNSVFG